MKFTIRTLGCKLNQFESEAIAESLRKAGHEIVASEAEAEAVVINTCTVTNRADVKSRQVMRQAKRGGKFVVATGCYATTDAQALDFVDLVVGNDKKFRIAEFLEGIADLGADSAGDFPEVSGFERTRAFLKVQDGCDKFCSYCKVPYARGRSRSLPKWDAVDAARRLLESGFREIVLTGVNTSGYASEGAGLFELTEEILGLPGEFRLRLSSLQPDEFDVRLTEFLAHPNFANHFHLSLQSGSDRVLKDMNRHYTAGQFLAKVEAIRRASPDCGITTDIIAGFPTETDEDFRQTLELTRRAEFTRVHLFAYSPRADTRAAKLPDLHGDVKKAREAELRQAVIDTGVDFTRREVLGRQQKVLVEASGGGKCEGYTSNYYRFTISEPLPENEFAVRAASAYEVSSEGIVEIKN